MMSENVIAAPTERDYDSDLDAPRRGRLRGVVWLTLGTVIAVGSVAWSWFLVRDSEGQPAGEPTGPVATAEVARATLTATESWGGRLGHGSPFRVQAKGEGTITGLADHDSQIERGSELYRLDEQPVLALIGSIPMYRDLTSGNRGADVRQLEANLATLGYDGFDVDETFTWYTALAVKRWQADLGAEKTGVVAQADVVFMPEGGRVDGIKVDVGDIVTPGAEVLDITSSDQIVSLDVAVRDRVLVDVDTEVTIRLPGGAEVAGTVTSTAVVEDTSDGGDGGGGGDDAAGAADTVAKVEVTLEDEVDDALLGSPVDVVVDVEEREHVLVVPVNALLALSEGGFGVEVVKADGTTTTVSVETGMFADGRVEIEGEDVDEGTIVGVAGR
ncbi:MAG: HlyD family efflux transporter periplasmic adaptor subunit [Nitriliruptorales bacterium]|nr:HlyD family efflux transporter periplasmic adaptor subunit [Nitriliruptorales bacterium]